MNQYVNLLTLVTLKIADTKSREKNLQSITKNLISESWIKVLKKSETVKKMPAVNYPKSSKTASLKNTNNLVVKEIIKQKLKSYESYNQLKTNVFLRNIQIYFAEQKCPKDNPESNTLRQYYMESLIQFTVSLIEASATSSKHLIRIENVQKALQKFMPYKVNLFEDVTFFANSENSKTTIESYDLDAFRDSGFHWNILDYSLNDLKNKSIKNIDPNAAELLAEGIA